MDIEIEICGLQTLPKLKEAHIYPEKIKKISVNSSSDIESTSGRNFEINGKLW